MSEHKGTIQIAGALCVQRGTRMLQAFTDAVTVSEHQRIDIFDPDTNAGYQRAPVTARVRKAARYYDEKQGRMPNPLLVNVRKQDMDEKRVVVVVDTDQAGYENAVLEGGNWIGTGRIEFSAGLALWIYDGQHRSGGLNQLLSGQTEYEDFPVPISLTLGLDPGEEMREFYEVNTNAAPVKTDLAWQLLTKMAEDDPELREMLAAEDKDWVTRAYAIVDELEKLDGPWRGRFQEANRRKTRGDGVTIPKPQFARSLKPVLDMPSFKRADAATVAAVLNAYWTGIKQVMPEPFEAAQDFVLQKGNGAVALHRVLPQVVEVVRSNGGRLGQPDAYAHVMTELPTLEGEAVDNDGQRTTRSGADFWRVGSVASGFSGDAGRRRLGLLIQSRLPSPAETIQL
ncbi:DGQHR domain-containing protein [Actinospica durhamensis]|uniref:DGQHR domain-containing protein n=1 Tax=Actinospica durhamensis TaxID=1508375 RepID=A0A941EMM0_9ACTN|nr:DGQHR domain-containing protein [Actinospica durhamensis]MBR7833287.1 DGQHR domain-containing protein [Actinospica durhamensis]